MRFSRLAGDCSPALPLASGTIVACGAHMPWGSARECRRKSILLAHRPRMGNDIINNENSFVTLRVPLW